MSEPVPRSRLAGHLGRLASVLLGLWIGAMLAIAFQAAPLVFGSVPEYIATKDAAARVIGPAFGRVDVFGAVACAAGLLAMWQHAARRGAGWRRIVLVVLLLSALADALWIAPAITSRTEPLRVYHGVATTLWMMNLIVGTFLLWSGLVPRARAAD